MSSKWFYSQFYLNSRTHKSRLWKKIFSHWFRVHTTYREPYPSLSMYFLQSASLCTSNFCNEILASRVMVSGGRAFGRWLGHEGSAFMNGIHIPMKEAEGSIPPFSPYANTATCHLCNRKSSSYTNFSDTVTFESSASKTMSSKFLLLINYLVSSISLQQQE